MAVAESNSESFAIRHLWQLKDSYTMNLILFLDDEIEAEDDDQSEDSIDQRVIYLSQSDYRTKHIESVLKAKSGETVRIGILHGQCGTAKVVWGRDQIKNDEQNETDDTQPSNLQRKPFHLKLEIIESSMKEIVDEVGATITLCMAMPRPKVLNRLLFVNIHYS